ncbi:MAG: restriction endonuclease subunit S [Methanolobus sp.]|uniref:restriction endonuclease subunit S n=1 Tax=Methanolobus sp. TaxID=1874737 RepID=UPI002730173B|nr:restriction endonuclease subunit S [Methanolobus sp.]MDP2216904.1 restriction endonuclease subunit S [Methanolobus sp.]
MNNDWPVIKLKNYCLKIGSGATPKGGNSVYHSEGEICLIRSQNVYNEGFRPDGLVYIDKEAADNLKNVIVEKNDILLNITGDSVARVCLVKDEYLPSRVNQHVALIRVNPIELDARFVRYFLASSKMQNLLLIIASSGATRNALTKSMIEQLEVPKPSLDIQKSIADKLALLDDKITLNTQINQTLESMAQAIFKSWFVDFDPVKAKIAAIEADENPESVNRAAMRTISGKSDDELDKMQAEQPDDYVQLEGIAELFPAAMWEAELGEVPEGWEVKKIGDYLNTISKTYPLKTVSEVIFLNTGDIQNGKVLHSNYSIVETLPGQAKKSIQKDDILYSEIRPENKRFAYVFFDGKEHVVSTKLMVLRPIADIDSKFLYFILTQQNTIDFLQMMAESRSGTFPQITFNIISKVEFFGPKDNALIHTFSKSILAPFMQERYLKDEENIQLSNLRDTLLPKLLSGELSVEGIELSET